MSANEFKIAPILFLFKSSTNLNCFNRHGSNVSVIVNWSERKIVCPWNVHSSSIIQLKKQFFYWKEKSWKQNAISRFERWKQLTKRKNLCVWVREKKINFSLLMKLIFTIFNMLSWQLQCVAASTFPLFDICSPNQHSILSRNDSIIIRLN